MKHSLSPHHVVWPILLLTAILFVTALLVGGCGGGSQETLSLEEQVRMAEKTAQETSDEQDGDPTALPPIQEQLEEVTYVPKPEEAGAILESMMVEKPVEIVAQSVKPNEEGKIDLQQFAGIESVETLKQAVDELRTEVRALASLIANTREEVSGIRDKTEAGLEKLEGDTLLAPHELLPDNLANLYSPKERWRIQLQQDIRTFADLSQQADQYKQTMDRLAGLMPQLAALSKAFPETQSLTATTRKHVEIYEQETGKGSANTRTPSVQPKLLYLDGTAVMVDVGGVKLRLREGQTADTPHGELRIVKLSPDTATVVLGAIEHVLRP